MSNSDSQSLDNLKELLLDKLKQGQTLNSVLRSTELKAKFDELKTLSPEERSVLGKQLNELKRTLETAVNNNSQEKQREAIDVTAPFDVNSKPSDQLLPTTQGSIHPIMQELEIIIDIFYRMGFSALESFEIDDEYHMFTSLNFPEDHPARDDYDTFMTAEKDKSGKPFVAPAHVSTMQNRLQQMYKSNLDRGEPIAVVYTGRTFRNEDIDARHEHTFYQVELSYIDQKVNAAQLISTIKAWLTSYFDKDVELKVQPFYFPFTEPSFEFAASCPFCDKKGCNICSYSGWIELGGCGMIHPNVLKLGGIDPSKYMGFAGGFGLERLVMLRYGIEDIRLFHNGRLEFLRQFK